MKLFTIILFGVAVGLILGLCGIFYYTWQYWVIIIPVDVLGIILIDKLFDKKIHRFH